MEVSSEGERDRLGAVPGRDDDRALDGDGVHGGLQRRPGRTRLDRHVRSSPGGRRADARGQVLTGLEGLVSAHFERQLSSLPKGFHGQHPVRPGELEQLGQQEADHALPEDERRLAQPKWRVVDDVQGGLHVGQEEAGCGVYTIG
jgi:hypothetical protein